MGLADPLLLLISDRSVQTVDGRGVGPFPGFPSFVLSRTFHAASSDCWCEEGRVFGYAQGRVGGLNSIWRNGQIEFWFVVEGRLRKKTALLPSTTHGSGARKERGEDCYSSAHSSEVFRAPSFA
jgi:hypothetical protein